LLHRFFWSRARPLCKGLGVHTPPLDFAVKPYIANLSNYFS
jgi:hypothetical protein